MIKAFCKIRNEEHIIKDTLDHWSQFVDEIYVVDESSTDRTVEICKAHPKVKEVIVVDWNPDREQAEWVLRQIGLTLAQRTATSQDWFCYFDADEFLYDFDGLEGDVIACKLYDVYITPQDVTEPYQSREMIGPEYRIIPFFFKNSPYLKYDKPDQRIIDLDPKANIVLKGSIKHFGKGQSIEQFEKTCDYYINHFPKYAEKWKERKGKAIHEKSDFNNKLIRWESRSTGFLLQE
jgi:glycosyltransferase involved in cell wall biosynthesis